MNKELIFNVKYNEYIISLDRIGNYYQMLHPIFVAISIRHF